MIPSLAPCFTGIFLWYKDGLALPGENACSIPGKDLLDKHVVEDLLCRFARTHPDSDRRALISMWTQWHFGALIIPVTAASLLIDRDLPVGLEHVSIALHEDGRTAAIVLPHDGGTRCPSATERFSCLFEGHIEPLIEQLSSHFRVSRRLLWTNAATIFDWTLQQAEALNASPTSLSEGRSLLSCKTDVYGRSNPMFGALQYIEEGEQTIRRRKVCCLRYLLPGMSDCGSLCPLPGNKN
jgi:ferric iron reductase protein FhuF